MKTVRGDCEACKFETISNDPCEALAKEAAFTVSKEYVINSLRHPTSKVFKMITIAENVFRH